MKFFTLLICILVSFSVFSKENSIESELTKIEKSLIYKTGIIQLENGNAKIEIPNGYKFLDKRQSIYVVNELWGNPIDSSIVGILVPNNSSVLDVNDWAFVICYSDIGFVKDDDADDINYDDLLKEMQKDVDEENSSRIKQGYPQIKLIGWASTPFYDKKLKVLHWAKELNFDNSNTNTLNYNLRILGRKGIYVLNAVGGMNDLQEVKSNIGNVINCIKFDDGYTYKDFLPDSDNVAAWTIGGLIAGKVLAKVGFFTMLLKFWKLIAISIFAVLKGFWNKIFKRKTGNLSSTENKIDLRK